MRAPIACSAPGSRSATARSPGAGSPTSSAATTASWTSNDGGSCGINAASITADLPRLAEEYGSRWLVADYRAGDMVVHSAYTVHAALDNVDPDGFVRLSTDIRYQRADQPIDLRWQNHWHDGDGL